MAGLDSNEGTRANLYGFPPFSPWGGEPVTEWLAESRLGGSAHVSSRPTVRHEQTRAATPLR